jgi:hypothetical protein
MPSAQPLVSPRCETTTEMRLRVEPLTDARPNRSGSWCTTMITATPARKPVMIGAERKSAIQPRRSSPMRATITPTITARIPTRST